MSDNLFEIVKNAGDFIQTKIKTSPSIGVVLGSGLYGLADILDIEVSIPNAEIPGFPISTVTGHRGRLLFGILAGKNVVLSDGRVHYYEGYPLSKVTLAMRVMAYLGCKKVILTNAVGGVREDLEPGDLVTVTDHINMMGTNPLRGLHDERFGERFPDLTNMYNPSLIQLAHEVAQELTIPLKRGILTATPGPSYESPAEIRMISHMGGDLVGMSVALEAIVAHQMSMEVLTISCVTNLAAGLSKTALTHEEVLQVSNKISKSFQTLIQGIISRM